MTDPSSSSAQYGYIAAAISCIAFGSFGVPIKSERSISVDIDPLVFQTYKTTMVLLTCWIVLLFGKTKTYYFNKRIKLFFKSSYIVLNIFILTYWKMHR